MEIWHGGFFMQYVKYEKSGPFPKSGKSRKSWVWVILCRYITVGRNNVGNLHKLDM
jgi:hypothetical protein